MRYSHMGPLHIVIFHKTYYCVDTLVLAITSFYIVVFWDSEADTANLLCTVFLLVCILSTYNNHQYHYLSIVGVHNPQ